MYTKAHGFTGGKYTKKYVININAVNVIKMHINAKSTAIFHGHVTLAHVAMATSPLPPSRGPVPV